MHLELTNLLPPQRIGRMRREYFYRLATVALLLGSALVVIHAILLMPAHQFVAGEIKDRSTELATLQASLATSDEQALDARVRALAREAATLAKLNNAPAPIELFFRVLSVPRSGVALTQLSLQNNGTAIVVTGTAATRDTLRNYDLALTAASFIKSVDLPVSAYAATSSIPFSLTIALSP